MLGFRVWGLGLGVWGLGFGAQGLWVRVKAKALHGFTGLLCCII